MNGKKGENAKVRFTTLDAGDPIDAKVKFGKKSAETGDDGKVKVKIKRKQKTRKVKARATADCFARPTGQGKGQEAPRLMCDGPHGPVAGSQ